MKDDSELKRLRRAIYILSVILLSLLIGITAWGSVELSRMKAVIASIEIPEVIKGIDGTDGYTPVKNVDYFDGLNGHNGFNAVSTHTVNSIYKEIPLPAITPTKEQIAEAVNDYCTVNDCKGDAGEKGDRGLTILIRLNPNTLLDECKILGDISWQPLEECGIE